MNEKMTPKKILTSAMRILSGVGEAIEDFRIETATPIPTPETVVRYYFAGLKEGRRAVYTIVEELLPLDVRNATTKIQAEPTKVDFFSRPTNKHRGETFPTLPRRNAS